MKKLGQHWTEQTIDYPEIGPVLFRRSVRARRLSIRIRSENSVQVSLPRKTSLEEARRFLESKSAWVRKHLETFRQRRLNRPCPTLTDEQFIDAQRKMVSRLRELAGAHGYRPNHISIRCQKTKWASCSGQNNISLNVNLIFLPAHLLDYVLLHELVHIHHKNHGPKFWAELDIICGKKAKALQKELRIHNMQIA